ncbi:MAG TPA: hypothetical protein VGK52_03815 [Polyangia bacterium]
MQHLKLSALFLAIAPLVSQGSAHADQYDQVAGPQITVVDPNQQAGVATPAGPEQENPIPPSAEGPAVQAQGGGYCYGGPHPAPGGGWEGTAAPHMHDYPPFDLRLFSYHAGCYYFIGDPHDFGYTGESYSYYGAHPILDAYGGGWCFMIGAHTHWWRPWSPYFTVVGPWYYWNGAYDPFFWSYWPYYSFFYRSYYPSYYAGGRFFRTFRAAPPIGRVPATGWRGGASGGWRGSPAGVSRANGAYGAPVGGWRGGPTGTGNAWHGAPAAGGGWRGSPVPNASSPLRAAPYGGGYRAAPMGGGGWHPAPAGGGWHPAPSGGGNWHLPSSGGGGGGFHSGGGFRGGRR